MTGRKSGLTAAAAIGTLALALAACGGPLLGGEVEDKKVCIAMTEQQVDGLHLDPIIYDNLPDTPPPELQKSKLLSNDFDVSSQLAGLGKKGTTGNVKMLSFTVTGEKSALEHIVNADLVLKSTSDASLVDDFSYVKSDASFKPNPDGTYTMNVTVDPKLDLFKLLASGKLHYDINFKGKPPNENWTIKQIETCLSAKLTVDAIEYAKNNM
jgi:hypothetical protein